MAPIKENSEMDPQSTSCHCTIVSAPSNYPTVAGDDCGEQTTFLQPVSAASLVTGLFVFVSSLFFVFFQSFFFFFFFFQSSSSSSSSSSSFSFFFFFFFFFFFSQLLSFLGVVGLILEANPSLSWIDIQDILVNTAVLTRTMQDQKGIIQNSVGLKYHPLFGFGLVHAKKAVDAALGFVLK